MALLPSILAAAVSCDRWCEGRHLIERRCRLRGPISTEMGSSHHVRFSPKATELRTWRDGSFVPTEDLSQ